MQASFSHSLPVISYSLDSLSPFLKSTKGGKSHWRCHEERGGATRKVFGFVPLRGRKLMASSAVKRGEEGGRKEGRGKAFLRASQVMCSPSSQLTDATSATRRGSSRSGELPYHQSFIFVSIVTVVRRETLDRIHSKRNDTCI